MPKKSTFMKNFKWVPLTTFKMVRGSKKGTNHHTGRCSCTYRFSVFLNEFSVIWLHLFLVTFCCGGENFDQDVGFTVSRSPVRQAVQLGPPTIGTLHLKQASSTISAIHDRNVTPENRQAGQLGRPQQERYT